MSKRDILISVAMLVVFGQSVVAQATTLVFQQDDAMDGYKGCVDTQLSADSSLNQCLDTNVVIDCCEPAPPCTNCPNQGLLRFDDIFGSSPNLIPFGSTIVSATLIVTVDSGGGLTTEVSRMLIPWNCDDIWSTFGGDGIQRDGTEAALVSEGEFPPPSGTQSIPVTMSLQSWSDGAANYGWVFAHTPESTSTNGWAFHSSEATTQGNRPKLEVTFAPPVPAVSTWGMLALVLLVMVSGTMVFNRVKVAT